MFERLNASERLIIQLLDGQPSGMLGLEMVKAANGNLKRGTLYIWLGRLEEKGVVESHPERTPSLFQGMFPRRRYRLSRRGKSIDVETSTRSTDLIAATA